MKIAVLGANGRTGSEFVRQALAAGNEIVAYVRRPETIEPRPGLRIVGGELDDIDSLATALQGCDAAVTTLGPKISESSAPIMQTAIPSLIEASARSGVNRVVVLSALGVGSTIENTRYPYRFGCRTFLSGNFRDHVAGESKLESSGLNWTTIHPGPLMNGARTKHPLVVDAATGRKMPGAPRTNRADVAATMLRVLDDPATFGKKLLVTSAVQNS